MNLIWKPYEIEKSEKNRIELKKINHIPSANMTKNAPFRPFSAIKYALDYASIIVHNIKGFSCRN
jgi:hypothetical protein